MSNALTNHSYFRGIPKSARLSFGKPYLCMYQKLAHNMSAELMMMDVNRHESHIAGYQQAVEALKSFLITTALMDRHISVERAVQLSRLEVEFQVKYSFFLRGAMDA